MSEYRLYPRDWPRCPACGREALEGHVTCGRVACCEAEQRVHLTPRPYTCMAYLDDDILCDERAITVDLARGIVVCAIHAPQSVPPRTGAGVWAK